MTSDNFLFFSTLVIKTLMQFAQSSIINVLFECKKGHSALFIVYHISLCKKRGGGEESFFANLKIF